MKYFIVVAILILAISQGISKDFGEITGQKGKVYYKASTLDESCYYVPIIAHLCNELIKIKGHSSPDVQLIAYYTTDSLFWSRTRIEINTLQETSEGVQSGINLFIYSPDKLLEKSLKLLEFSIDSLTSFPSLIKNEVSGSRIKNILYKENTASVELILKQEVYREFDSKDYEVDQIYFFKNDHFHFFQDDIIYLKLPSIYKIIDVPNYQYLVFDTDCSFYYYDFFKKSISNRIIIEGIKEKLSPFMLSYYDRYKGRIYLEYETINSSRENMLRKFLLLTDKLIFIEDYDKLEDKIIQKRIKKN